MFKKQKDFLISSNSILSKQDLKVIKKFALTHYININEEILDDIIPRKVYFI